MSPYWTASAQTINIILDIVSLVSQKERKTGKGESFSSNVQEIKKALVWHAFSSND